MYSYLAIKRTYVMLIVTAGFSRICDGYKFK